jgi:tetratricopeptide (TPR) repeat protein
MRNTLEVLTLEKQWRIWKVKQACKHIFTTLVLGGVSFSCIALFLSLENRDSIIEKQPAANVPSFSQTVPTKTESWMQHPFAFPIKENSSGVAKKRPKEMQKTPETAIRTRENQEMPQVSTDIGKEQEAKHGEAKEVPPEKISIAFKTVQKETIGYLKKKFSATRNIVFALMLAEEYLHLGSYKEALRWALVANEIDPKNERSWILFAKTKAKLNGKNEAIIVLEEYLK